MSCAADGYRRIGRGRSVKVASLPDQVAMFLYQLDSQLARLWLPI
jgi:hypothetical protein